jgi:hypothetical protein
MRRGREPYPSRCNTSRSANDVNTQVLRDQLNLAATRFVMVTSFWNLSASGVFDSKVIAGLDAPPAYC